jgi:HD-GYP domain-containing protein (c-di-GMP phosphodiesterase class II)
VNRAGRDRGSKVGENLEVSSVEREEVRAAEVIGSLSLATDLGIGVPLEHGLLCTLVAVRLADRLGLDEETTQAVFYSCLLFYVGCTAGAELAAEVFGADDALTTYGTPVRFGSRVEMVRGMLRAVAPPRGSLGTRASQLARLPRLAREIGGHAVASCEVAQMLIARLGLPAAIGQLFGYTDERWDGKGIPGRAGGRGIPLAMRVVQVARDATFQALLTGESTAVEVIAGRAGHAFDPQVADALVAGGVGIFRVDADRTLWETVLDAEPAPRIALADGAIDNALAAIGDFADLASRYLVGHSSAVSRLAGRSAEHWVPDPAVQLVRRAGRVHDLGRVAVPVRVWNHPGSLATGDWEQVRLHAYYTERVLSRMSTLAAVADVASFHHERLDGSGYHRGAVAREISRPARLVAAADVYTAMTAARPHRAALTPARAAEAIAEDVKAGCLDAEAVAAVLAAAGQPVPSFARPAGLTEREATVIGLLARGLQTKQIAAALGISVKTADRHIQNAYAKIGVSTRAAATLFAMEHDLVAWGDLPIGRARSRS